MIWKLHYKLWQECLATAINAVLKVTANDTAHSPIHPVTQIITWSCCIVAVLLVGHHMGQTTIWELPRHHLLLESLHKMLWTLAMWVSDFVWWRLERRADLVWDFDKLKLGGIPGLYESIKCLINPRQYGIVQAVHVYLIQTIQIPVIFHCAE